MEHLQPQIQKRSQPPSLPKILSSSDNDRIQDGETTRYNLDANGITVAVEFSRDQFPRPGAKRHSYLRIVVHDKFNPFMPSTDLTPLPEHGSVVTLDLEDSTLFQSHGMVHIYSDLDENAPHKNAPRSSNTGRNGILLTCTSSTSDPPSYFLLCHSDLQKIVDPTERIQATLLGPGQSLRELLVTFLELPTTPTAGLHRTPTADIHANSVSISNCYVAPACLPFDTDVEWRERPYIYQGECFDGPHRVPKIGAFTIPHPSLSADKWESIVPAIVSICRLFVQSFTLDLLRIAANRVEPLPPILVITAEGLSSYRIKDFLCRIQSYICSLHIDMALRFEVGPGLVRCTQDSGMISITTPEPVKSLKLPPPPCSSLGLQKDYDIGGSCGIYCRISRQPQELFVITNHHVVSKSRDAEGAESIHVCSPTPAFLANNIGATKKNIRALGERLERVRQLDATKCDALIPRYKEDTLRKTQSEIIDAESHLRELESLRYSSHSLGRVEVTSGLGNGPVAELTATEKARRELNSPTLQVELDVGLVKIDKSKYNITGTGFNQVTIPNHAPAHFHRPSLELGISTFKSIKDTFESVAINESTVCKLDRYGKFHHGHANLYRSVFCLGDIPVGLTYVVLSEEEDIEFGGLGDSGSPVWNRDGDVVGLFFGYNKKERRSYVMDFQDVRDFLESATDGIISPA